MKRISIIVILIIIQSFALADIPPCWCEFKIESENGVYFASVTRFEADSLKEPRDSRWKLTVYKKDINDITIWSTLYDYDGYANGLLSKDGNIFTYVNFWYFNSDKIVKIYNEGKLVGNFEGKEFMVPSSKLVKTVSHELWLSENQNAYELVKNEDSFYLKIYTIDEKVHLIDCKTGELK